MDVVKDAPCSTLSLAWVIPKAPPSRAVRPGASKLLKGSRPAVTGCRVLLFEGRGRPRDTGSASARWG